MKKLVCVLLAVLTLISLTACQGGAAENEIYVGVLAPLTGDVAVYGNSVANSAKMAFDAINEAGGVAGKKIKYEIVDEKGDPTEAVNAYNLLKGKGVDFIFGDVTTKPTLAICEMAAADGIPMLTSTASHKDVTPYGDNIFRACYIDPFQGQILANFASGTLGCKKVAIMYNVSDDYSNGIAVTFQQTAENLGMEVVAMEGYGASDVDFKTQLTTIKNSGAEAFLMPDYYSKSALVAGQCAEIGLTIPQLGPDGVDGVFDVVEKGNVSILNNIYFANHYFVGDPNPIIQNFVTSYTEKYNTAPNALSALGYDGANMIAKAYEITNGDTDYTKVIEAIKGMTYTGVTGTISYTENSDAEGNTWCGDPNKSVSILHIQDGAYTLAATVEP